MAPRESKKGFLVVRTLVYTKAAAVLLLLGLEDVVDKVLLKLLVAEIDAKLLKKKIEAQLIDVT